MAFEVKRATFTASAGPVVVTWTSAFSNATYFIVAGPAVTASTVNLRISAQTTTTASVTADAAFTGTVDVFGFE